MATVGVEAITSPSAVADVQWCPPARSTRLPCELFELFGPTLPSDTYPAHAARAAASSSLPPSLVPLPCSLLAADSIASWKRAVQAARQAAAVDAVILTAADSDTTASAAEVAHSNTRSVFINYSVDSDEAGCSIPVSTQARLQLLTQARVSSLHVPLTLRVDYPVHRVCNQVSRVGRLFRILVCPQLHLSSLSVQQLSARCEVWDACSPLSSHVHLRLLPPLSSPAFPLSLQSVAFVSRLSYCLLELDSEYELVVSSAARSPASFHSNSGLHASQQFLTYAELPSVDQCGSFTEFVQWRRRICELRARGWGYCHISAQANQQTEAEQWRIDRLNSIAREQSRKNFTPFTANSASGGRSAAVSGIDQLRSRLLKETESKGVQLLLGNAPTPLDWRSHLSAADPTTTTAAAQTSVSSLALIRFLCLAFGALRRGGDFAFLVTGAEQLLSSPLLHSALRLLTGCFSLVALRRCAVSVGLYGSGEVWLIGKGFVVGHADERSERLRVACSQLLAGAEESEVAALSIHTRRVQLTEDTEGANRGGNKLLHGQVQTVQEWSAHATYTNTLSLASSRLYHCSITDPSSL